MFCEVYLLDTPYHIDRPFDYSCGASLTPGNIVRVPFGRAGGTRLGVAVKVKDECEIPEGVTLKSVSAVVSPIFTLTEEMLGLCRFLKEFTLCTFGEAVRTVLPPGALSESLNVRYRKTARLLLDREAVATLLTETGRRGIRSEGQRTALRFLMDLGAAEVDILKQLPGVTPAHISALRDKGVLAIDEDEEIRNPYADYARTRDTSEIVLSRAQMAAYETIDSLYSENEPRAALLYGITGSGKTKVIMKAIDRTIADGKSVIMLVPEISLTPQTVSIFCRRYGERVAVIHSSLSQGERLDAWRRIRRGDVDLVIGTRSAIFAPLDNIGMIVIDEEHEHTYKSESDPKYHARDIASYRCGKHKALMLLASATPAVESFYKAKTGAYTLVPLRERYGGARLPKAVIVDMREELRLGNPSPISQRLYNMLTDVKENENQAILFLNRRGYSSHISCKECGEVLECPRCSVSLTFHSHGGGAMLCHMCGYRMPTPRACPSCSAEALSFLGFGTQKLESEMSKYLPEMTLMRMDADTTQGKLAYDRMLDDFRAGRADILLGTQMVAKGHDFPRVTLVGVALADTSLHVTDFRAAERTFSLLTQVIGRAGRASEEGVAVIQTFQPNNETIRLACRQDYDSFYEGEIALRRELSYPPFCDMAQLTLTADDEAELSRAADTLSAMVKAKLDGEYANLPFVVYGPFEAQIYKLNEKYRMRMMVKCKLNARSRKMFSELLTEFAKDRKVTLAVDLNPLTV
ncbi:MAG: primosomal protein N' [Clostridia bacterium]|nr:primosomal protein N' [Clostridia bacterium]